MPNKSKSKGNKFELDIAKALSDATGEPWLRSAGSGAFFGGKNSERMSGASEAALRDRAGDVTPPDGWDVTVEIKRYKELPDLLHGPSALVDGFLKQLTDSAPLGSLRILIMKADRKPALIGLPMVQAHRFGMFPNTTYVTAMGQYWKFFMLDNVLTPNGVASLKRVAMKK